MTYSEDVMKAAERIANEAVRTAMQDPLMPMAVHLKPAIARAIIAERERCAKVAQSRADLSRGLAAPAIIAILDALPDALRRGD